VGVGARAKLFAAKSRAKSHSSRDLRGILHSRSGPKFARIPTPAGYAGYYVAASANERATEVAGIGGKARVLYEPHPA